MGEQREQPKVASGDEKPQCQLWKTVPADNSDPEQYRAINNQTIRDDPVLRLALRDSALETTGGTGVRLEDGVCVKLDSKERTVMAENVGGATRARAETMEAVSAAADLHAKHHFTCAAAVDGSMREEVPAGGGLRRRIAYGIWEGPRGMNTARERWQME